MISMEVQISRVLRLGVTLSLIFLVTGTVLSFIHHPEYRVSAAAMDRLMAPRNESPGFLAGVAPGLRHGRGQALVAVGLLLLILTPVTRVAMSLVLFLRQGDRAFSAITAFVLVLILVSMLLGKAA